MLSLTKMRWLIHAVPVTFLADMSLIDFGSTRQGYNDYRLQTRNRAEADCTGSNGGVHLDTLPEKDVLWAEFNESEGHTEESLLAMSSLVLDGTHVVRVSKKGYLHLLPSLASKWQLKRCECTATTRLLDERATSVEEVEMKIRFLADKASKLVWYSSGLTRKRRSLPQKKD